MKILSNKQYTEIIERINKLENSIKSIRNDLSDVEDSFKHPIWVNGEYEIGGKTIGKITNLTQDSPCSLIYCPRRFKAEIIKEEVTTSKIFGWEEDAKAWVENQLKKRITK